MAKNATQNKGHQSFQREAKLTVLTSDHGIATKECHIDAEGNFEKKSNPNFAGGSYKVVTVRNLTDFMKLRSSLVKSEALMFSVPINGSTQGRITVKKRRAGVTLSRSLDCFGYPEGAGIMVIDIDPPQDRTPQISNQLIKLITSIVPAISNTQILWATSAGSCIYDEKTKTEHVGITGQRLYFIVEDACDIPRALKALDQRMWLNGQGWIKISRSGRMLKRSLVDVALANPVQPDFAAGAVCHPPLVQRAKQKLIGKGGPIDTKTAIPDLSTDEIKQLTALQSTAEAKLVTEAHQVREEWLQAYADRAVTLVTAHEPVTSEDDKARIRETALRALNENHLGGDFPIMFADRSIVTVAEILKHPARFHCVTCLDPVEPDYDNHRVVAKIFTSPKPVIHSFAHGEQTYTLSRQRKDIEWREADSAVSVQDTLEVLRHQGRFFDFGNALVHVEGTDLHVLTPATAIHYIGNECRFWYSKPQRSGTVKRVDCDPPEKLVKQLIDLGERRNLRKLVATSNVPLIVPNGQVVCTNGYDEDTGILLSIDEDTPIPTTPTAAQVRAALRALWQPFHQFPFVDEGARSNTLAAILTAVIRRVIPASLGIAVDAPQRGTGKTKLLRSLMALHCGGQPDLSPLPSGPGRDEELRKKITTTLLEGRDHVLFDNIVGNFDSASLAALMTSGRWSDRILGRSQGFNGNSRLLIGVNGNNLALVGELPRRFLQIRLDAGLENPFGRQFDFDPEDVVVEQRPQLIAAAITAMRGWFASGLPDAETASIGSFEEWGQLVRGPLRWFATEGLLPFDGFRDPLDMLTSAVETDPEHEEFANFLAAWKIAFGEQERSAKEVNDSLLCRQLDNSDAYSTMRDFLTDLSRSGLSAKSVASILKNRRDRPAGGLKLVGRVDRVGIMSYRVVAVD